MSTIDRGVRTLARPLVHRYGSPVGSVTAVRTEAPHVVLTFDDGPEPGGTEAVLSALDDHNATATFFVLLTRTRRYGGLLDEVLSQGNEVALHGIDHRPLTGFPSAEAERRTAAGKAELEDRIGREVKWFRPPYGRQTLTTWRATRHCGLAPVMWGATTWDWKDVSQEARVAKALSGSDRGTILLAHDAFAVAADGADDGPAPVLDKRDLINRVLTALGGRGLAARSLGEALMSGVPVRTPWFHR